MIIVTRAVDEILETLLMEEGMEEGVDDYIRKLLDLRRFLDRVEATIRRAET